jgi:Rhodopirellula transposase DDE domain
MDTSLREIVTPDTAGDPMGARKWRRRRLRTLRQRLAHLGQAASAPTVSRVLKKHDDARRVNAQEKEAGAQHPDRDTPFPDLAAQKQADAVAGYPIIRVDTKTKAWIGDFKNAGQLWCQHPIEVNVHDFPSDALGRAVPYGIDDLQHHHGAVSVGDSGDTPEFAVGAMTRWWEHIGRVVDPQASRLLSWADPGGSTGCRPRRWKAPRQSQGSDRLGLHVTVCHDPTGGSQWNPREPRVFSHMRRNWAGQPLRTLETRLGSLRDTTTTTGLGVTASPLEGVYQTGKRVADAVMQTLEVEHQAVCPQWNYTIHPRGASALTTGVCSSNREVISLQALSTARQDEVPQ